MKVCVTSQGPEMDSQVDPRFGRARYFITQDDEDDSYDVIDNAENKNAAGGAGISAATIVADMGCDWVISGHMGPKALSVLKDAGVRVATGASGTVKEALKAFQDGELEEAEDADVSPHW